MVAAVMLPPCTRDMEVPPDPGIPPRLGRERTVRAGEGSAAAAAAAAVELPWGLRPVLCRKALRERRRGSDCFPTDCRDAGELYRSLAPQLDGPVSRGRREEEPGAEPLPPTGSQQPVDEGTAPLPSSQPGGTGLKFGLLAPELHARLLDQEDYRNRTQAVEELKRVVEDASQVVVTSVPAPSILGFIGLLCTLLSDFNFKVVLGALEVICLLALRLDNRVKDFLTPLFSAVTKVLGDSKLAVRQGYRRLLRWLMKAVGPQQVLDLLLQQEYRQHKNSKVREEVINMCIVALLTYPSEELDLGKLAFELAPALVDNKHRVRHAAMEAFAVLASAMGPGKTTLLFKAVDAVELKDNGDGLMHAVQARLARKILPKLTDQGFVEYAVPLPSSCHNRESCLPPGADTDWLLMCDRTRSAHSYCGYEVKVDALQNSSSHSAGANQVAHSRKVLSTYKIENKLPWENKHAEDKEVGSGVKMPVAKGVEQFPTSSDLLHFPELRPSQGVPVSDELHFSRKRTSGNFIQNSIDFNSEHSSVCAGPVGSHQPQISGKCGKLGYTQTRGKSGSVESDLQFLGLSNCQQDKGCTSLNFSSKTQRSFCNQAENTVPFQGPNASQGTFTLPTCPLSSPRNSPKHVSSPAYSPRKSQGENLQEKRAPLQLKPILVRQPAPCRPLNGTKPIPPIPRLLPDKVELNLTKWRKEECKDMRLNKADGKLAAADLSDLTVDGEEVDQEENRVALSKCAQDKMKRNGRKEKEYNHKEYLVVKDLGGKDQKPGENLEPNEPEIKTAENEISVRAQEYCKERRPSVTGLMNTSELLPFSKPETALTEALTLLAADDWEKKMEGLNFVRCLSAYHATILTAKLHETSIAVAQEVKNLRSGVSRAAVICLGDLFTYLKKSMDQELDYTVKILLHKAGESNTFIREEVDKALKAMVNNVTPARALCALIDGGQSHLNSAVRSCTARHLSDTVEHMGLDRILSKIKVVADRLFPAIVRFTQDSSQQTRYYGQKMLFSMMTHPDFDKTIEKYVLTKDLPYIRKHVAQLREKGLGGLPLDTPSAKGRHSHTRSVGRLRDTINITDRETTEAYEVKRKTAPRNLLENEEYVKDITGLLTAKDFRDRIRGIKQLLLDAEHNQGFVVANIVKIFDAFNCRLNDLNGKVNRIALETMHQIIPLLKDNLSPVINMLIPAVVDNNLNSRNPGIYAAAKNVIQALCQHLDNYLLLQPFCTKAQFLNGKAKQDITEKLADIVRELYPRKPKSVEQKVLVVLWHLLGNMTNSGSLPGTGGNIRTATAKLSKALFAQMGPRLLTCAAAQSPHIKKTLEELLEAES
ncbi:TOG array regulator of axonemal microtubules protein 1-like isoform X1 [Melopsittacus undulatus]|uniref:TOG array regulator of axonemal microtubules protein 1-like isoform X1 n=1 Tax=Melopsittacus undulatus TaxID=13146 RepID=UPI001469DF19|nr:TOG array regulator of axonemal microtubules protein 1-like isoform X1 [Melopsittacus undulatus]